MKTKEKAIVENIVSQPMDELMSDRYAVYAKYVIQDRAIPDARDGLKPVQRRIIYTMFNTGNTYDKNTKKCAKIVGDVMGRFHPHGDTSIYDALTRLSQDWKMNQPLVYFQGNNGSIDNDPAAAYRYTEAKLEEVSEYLVKDLDKKIVDMTLNFSDDEFEPVVLPARFPNLFVNGSDGIAVAIATAIPPHNLGEMCLSTIYRINNPECDIEDLMKIVQGPDFPTGGIISGVEGIKEMYETGRGKFQITSKYEIKEFNDHNEIVVSEIPYGINKKDLVFSIDKIRKNKDIDGINEVNDLSSGDSINIVVDLKKEINPNVVLQYLLNKTNLRVNYNANIVAICDKHPETLSLTRYLDVYIDFLREINLKQYKFDYEKTKARLHILDGLLKSVDIIDEIIKIIRNSVNKEDSKEKLMSIYKFSDVQAEAILNIRLYKLSHTDINIYLNEKKELEEFFNFCDKVINNPKELDKVIIGDLKDIIKKVPSVRKSKIEKEINDIEISKRDLITKETIYVSLTRDGYLKRSTLKSYKASDSKLPGIKEGDNLILATTCSTLDYILGFTNLGNFVFIPVHEVIENKWKEEGKHINYLTNLPLNEYLIKAVIVEDFSKDISIGIVSKKGQIKKTSLNEFFVQRYSKPIQCMKLIGDDEVVDVALLNNDSNLLILTSNGICTYFNENEISQTGIKSGGVKAISKLSDNYVVNLLSFDKDETDKIILFTNHACYRVFDTKNLELTARLGAQQRLFKAFKSDPHDLIYTYKLKEKEPLDFYFVLQNHNVIKQSIDDYSITPIDKRCKYNLSELPEDIESKFVYTFIPLIVTKDFKVEPKKTKVEEKEEVNEQLSLFN